MNNDNKEKIFEIVNEYLEWVKEIPKSMELYETKMKEFAKEKKECFLMIFAFILHD